MGTKSIDISVETIENTIDEFRCKEHAKENALEKVFSDENYDDAEGVLIRTVLLNQFYSTMLNMAEGIRHKNGKVIVDVFSMADRIANCKGIHESIRSNEKSKRMKAFNHIAYDEDKENEVESYNACLSFASKYCSWINPTAFPIFDRYSKGMLYYINKQNNYCNRKLTYADLRDYDNFCEIHEAFRKQFLREDGSPRFSTKEIDMYLWLYGKKYNIKIEN